MDTAILSSVIGASAVMLAAMLGVIFSRIFNALSETNTKVEDLGRKVEDLGRVVAGQETRFTGEIKSLETRFTGEIKSLEIRLTEKFTAAIMALDAKFTDQIAAQGRRIDGIYDVLRQHGERLARIELKLGADPPAEAA